MQQGRRRYASLQRFFAHVVSSAWLATLLLSQVEAKPQRRLHFFTFSDTLPHPGLCVLAQGIQELGGILRVLGLSKKPGYLLIQSHSPTLKFIMLQEVIEYELSIKRIAPDDLMIFVDGHDVLLQRPLSELLEAYERWPDSPYLISGESNCWPWPHTDPSHGDWDPGMAVNPNSTWIVNRYLKLGVKDFCRVVDRRGPYPYPNIGTSMGPVGRVLEVLKRNNRIVIDEDMNDQGAMWLVILRHAVELNIEIDQNAEVFLNMLQYKPGDLEREPCVDDWFAPTEGKAHGVPPRNLLTGSTPALLHFNGPSHEDDIWPSCFHVFNREFRENGLGNHRLFDIDHNMLLKLDDICEYGFYNIRDFHIHPLSGDAVQFLAGFYKLPVDPGLAAWRGNASEGDLVKWGTEAELHRSSPHLRQALEL